MNYQVCDHDSFFFGFGEGWRSDRSPGEIQGGKTVKEGGAALKLRNMLHQAASAEKGFFDLNTRVCVRVLNYRARAF